MNSLQCTSTLPFYFVEVVDTFYKKLKWQPVESTTEITQSITKVIVIHHLGTLNVMAMNRSTVVYFESEHTLRFRFVVYLVCPAQRGNLCTSPLICSLVTSKYYDERCQLLCCEKVLCVVTGSVCFCSCLI